MSAVSYSKAIVLGAGGFIGVNLVRELVRRGLDVTCFSRLPSPAWPAECSVVLGDFCQPPAGLLDAFENAMVFHLVSSTRPSAMTTMAGVEVEQNVLGTIRFLEASRDTGCRWVFASSGGTVYGEPLTPSISEDHPTNPISSYGVSKLAIEKYLLLYQRLHGLDCVIARIGNPYGPGQLALKGQGLVAAILRRLAAGVPIEIWGDGTVVRDYIYIGDTVDALIRLASTAAPASIYNVGTGIGTSVDELIQLAGRVSGQIPQIAYSPARGVDVSRNVLDITRLRTDLGWTPKTDLADGMRSMREWLAQIDAPAFTSSH